MIRVNLIPAKEKKKRQELFVVICLILVLILVVLGLAWNYGLRLTMKNNLTKEINRVDEESKGYQGKIAEINDLKNKESSLETIKKTIKGISDAQRIVIMAVDQFALNLPDGVWLTSITQGKDGNVFTVQGFAFAESNLQSYFNSIKKPGGMLKEAALTINNISATVGHNRQIYQFTISAKVAGANS